MGRNDVESCECSFSLLKRSYKEMCFGLSLKLTFVAVSISALVILSFTNVNNNVGEGIPTRSLNLIPTEEFGLN